MICPKCKEIYNIPQPFSTKNGSAFSSEWTEHLFEKYKDIFPSKDTEQSYEPRIFGFKLRQIPEQIEESEEENCEK